ncbi:hypothetical protein GGR58DRAFT_498937 [Xylaria digitata]|nr:hypothetical protein GGR58DRAFT_498937 [Xylaria digitata]
MPPGTSDPNGTTGSADGGGAGGGTVGGVVFLLLLAVGLWWLIRKMKSPGQQQQQQHQQQQQQQQNNYPSPKPEGEQLQQPTMVELGASRAPAEVQGDSAYELYGHMQRPAAEVESEQVWYSGGGHPQQFHTL